MLRSSTSLNLWKVNSSKTRLHFFGNPILCKIDNFVNVDNHFISVKNHTQHLVRLASQQVADRIFQVLKTSQVTFKGVFFTILINGIVELDFLNLNRIVSDSFLDRATLDGATLDGATLDGATLDGATLDGAWEPLDWDRETLDRNTLDWVCRRLACYYSNFRIS